MYNLNYCLNLVQMDRQDRSTKNIERYSEYILMAYRDLKFKILPGVSVAYLTPNDALIANLPKDYVFYTKMSIIVNGVAYTLTVNDRIPIPITECGVDVSSIGDITNPDINVINGEGFYYASHYRAGQYVGEFYSMGGKNNSAGFFRIDEQRNQIIFRGVPKSTIVMEYVDDGSHGLSTFIPATAVVPIRNFVHWQLKEHSYGKEKVNDNEKQRAKNIYDESKLVLKNITNTPTIDDFIDVMYAGFQSSLKGVAI